MSNGFDRYDNWVFVVIGVICVTGGLKGVLTRQGRTRSRGGHVKYYVGRDAVIQGVIGIVFGIAIIVFGAINLI